VPAQIAALLNHRETMRVPHRIPSISDAIYASGKFLGGLILPGHGIMLREQDGKERVRRFSRNEKS